MHSRLTADMTGQRKRTSVGPVCALLMLAVFHGAAAVAADATAARDAAVTDAAQAERGDRFILFDDKGMAAVRERLAAGDERLGAILADVVAEADKYLGVEPVSVTDQALVPPSGDRRDYISMSPYYWPNPDTPDGLPYVRRDGEFNPERADYDTDKLDTLRFAVQYLGMAYYFTGDERYAEHAARHLRHFFLDEETGMNPNLQYAQFVPGLAEQGRKSGIIETVRLRWVVDSINMLRGSPHWPEADHAAMQRWFADYVRWLLTSEHGRAEARSDNNHGTWHTQQVMLYSLFAGDAETARAAARLIPGRIHAQIEPDGSQPLEIARTRGLHYCDFNLRAYFDIARMAEPLGIDLWTYETPGGAGLRDALAFNLPYMTAEQVWDWEQIDEPNWYRFAQTLRWAAHGYDDPRYERLINEVPGGFGPHAWIELVVPAPGIGR